jgi:hypothetical protein
VRQTRFTSLAFYDLCRKHEVTTETDLWAKATELDDQADRAMLGYLLDNDGDNMLAKV